METCDFWIYVKMLNYRSRSSCKEIGGASYGEEEGLIHGINRPRKDLRQHSKGGSMEMLEGLGVLMVYVKLIRDMHDEA